MTFKEPQKLNTELTPTDENADSTKASSVGPQLDDRYEILAKIGEGGMGTVYKVNDRVLEKVFAVKMVKDELLEDKSYVKRFEQEAQGAIGLTHPNIVSVYGHRLNPDGKPYLVMDFHEGESLGQLLEREGRLDLEQTIEIFSQVADALHHAHAKGIVHRDLKPNNILLVPKADGGMSVKVLDFGIAKIIMASGGATTQGMTQEQQVLGSPFYMSPEQCRADKLDARADIYALGCVMFEVLSGKPPYQAETPIATLMRHVSSEVATFDVELGLPQEIKQVVSFCMQKDPSDRFQTMQELKDDLERVRGGGIPKCAGRLKKPKRSTKSSTNSGTASATTGTTSNFPLFNLKERNKFVLAGVALIPMLLVYIGWQFMSSHQNIFLGSSSSDRSGAWMFTAPLMNRSDPEAILKYVEETASRCEVSRYTDWSVKVSSEERRNRQDELRGVVNESRRCLIGFGTSAIPVLMKHANSESDSVRRLVVDVLKEAAPDSIPGMAQVLISNRSKGMENLRREYIRMGRPAVEALTKEISNDGTAKARMALELLAQTYATSGSPSIFEVSEREKLEQVLLTSTDVQARKLAVIILSSTGAQDETVRSAVIKSALSDKNVSVRTMSLSALGAIANAEGTTASIETLKIIARVLETDKDSYVRFAAATAIGANGSKAESVKSSVEKAINDRDAAVGVAAKTAIALMKPPAWGPEMYQPSSSQIDAFGPITASSSIETIRQKLDQFPSIARRSYHTYPKNTPDSPGFSVPILMYFISSGMVMGSDKQQTVDALINIGQYGALGIPWVYFHSLNSDATDGYSLRSSASRAIEKITDPTSRSSYW